MPPMDLTQAVTAAVTLVTKKRKAKVPAPTKYDGTKEKLPIFIKEVKDWLADNEVVEEQDKIWLTAAYLKKGDAVEWLTQQSEDSAYWRTYNEFLTAVQCRFGDVDSNYTARHKLEKLKQMGSVEEYNTEFSKYAKKIGFSDEDLADRYQKGLSDRILQSIYNLKNLPDTLVKWANHALHFDWLNEQLCQMQPGVCGVGFDRTKVPITEPQPVKPQPWVRAEDYAPGTTGPMDINTAQWEKKMPPLLTTLGT